MYPELFFKTGLGKRIMHYSMQERSNKNADKFDRKEKREQR